MVIFSNRFYRTYNGLYTFGKNYYLSLTRTCKYINLEHYLETLLTLQHVLRLITIDHTMRLRQATETISL